MSKTLRTFKKEKNLQLKERKLVNKRFFDHTDGSHSKVMVEREVIDDGDGGLTVIYKK